MHRHTEDSVLKCKFRFSYLKQRMFLKPDTFELLGFRVIIGKRDKVSIDEIARVVPLLSALNPAERSQNLLTKIFLRDSIELHPERLTLLPGLVTPAAGNEKFDITPIKVPFYNSRTQKRSTQCQQPYQML